MFHLLQSCLPTRLERLGQELSTGRSLHSRIEFFLMKLRFPEGNKWSLLSDKCSQRPESYNLEDKDFISSWYSLLCPKLAPKILGPFLSTKLLLFLTPHPLGRWVSRQIWVSVTPAQSSSDFSSSSLGLLGLQSGLLLNEAHSPSVSGSSGSPSCLGPDFGESSKEVPSSLPPPQPSTHQGMHPSQASTVPHPS